MTTSLMNTPNGVDLHIEAVALARDVPGIAEEIASYAQTIGLDLQASFKLKISIAEALNNIAGHGVDPEHPGIIKITCRRSERVLEISIIDTGRPIDTLPTGLFPLYDVEHGRGWPIMVSWIDQIEYQPGPPFNRLSLTKHLW